MTPDGRTSQPAPASGRSWRPLDAQARALADHSWSVDTRAVQPIRYATTSDDVSVAYQVVGSGDVDLIAALGIVTHLEVNWEEPAFARFLGKLASFSRLVLFDKRGVGLSEHPRCHRGARHGQLPVTQQLDASDRQQPHLHVDPVQQRPRQPRQVPAAGRGACRCRRCRPAATS